MNSKLVASIAIAMMAVISLSMFTVLPAHALPNIYMVPNTINGATVGLGNTIDVTVWATGWGNPPVFAFQVDLIIANMAAGVIITKAVLPAPTDSSYILFGHSTARPAPALAVDGSSVKVGDTSLDTSATPPPEPAKLAVITLKVVAAPGKYQTLTTALNINNPDTYLLDDALATIPITATDGTYSWVWTAPTTHPDVAVVLQDPGLPGATLTDAQHLQFDQYHNWNGTNFVANVYIQNLDIGWAISGASFSMSYSTAITNVVSAVLDPAWTGTVNTGTPGTIAVSATTAASLSGNVKVLTVTFQIHDQYSAPDIVPIGTVFESQMILSSVTLQDTVGPIPLGTLKTGYVFVTAKQTLLSPWLSISPTPIISGTDLVIGNQFGKTFTVNVLVNGLDNHWGTVAVQFRVQYDHNYVQFVSAAEGPYMLQFAPFGTFFVAVPTLGDVLYGDNVAIGDLLLPDANGTWSTFAGGNTPSSPQATGVVAQLTFAYVKQDFVNTFNTPLNILDFNYGRPLLEQTWFVKADGTAVPPAAPVNGMVIIQPISTIGRRIDVWMQYPAPYGGQGLNQPADLVVPQQLIILTAKVTYNWWPVTNKKVTFNIYDNQGNLVAVLEAITGQDGHATTSYRMPWPNVNPASLFGVWTVIASASVADQTVTDTLTFHYDYLVEILNAVVDKVSYNHLDYMAVTVTYGSHAQQMYPVFMTATLQDNLLVPVSTAFTGLSVSGATYCTLKVYPTASLTLYVPYYAYAGAAQVRVDFLDKSPMDLTHTAVTPEFTITGLYILPV